MATTTPAARPRRSSDPPQRVVDVHDMTERYRFPGDLIELIADRRRALGGLAYRDLAKRAGTTIGSHGESVPRLGHSTLHDFATIPRWYQFTMPPVDKLLAIADALTARDLTVTLEMVTVAAAASLGMRIMPRVPGEEFRPILLGARTPAQMQSLRDPFGVGQPHVPTQR